MALISVKQVNGDTQLGLWRLETMQKGNVRQQERAGVLQLLHQMTGNDSLVIGHQDDGKPYVEGYNISISHTRGYATILLSRSHEVGIDIEYRSCRVARIVSRFIRPDEVSPSVESQLIHWSAKEAVFKYFSTDRLQLFEMRILPFVVAEQGLIQVENMKRGQKVNVHYLLTDDYVLTYTVG